MAALAALLCPFAVGTALSIHLLSDHHDGAVLADGAGLEMTLHGHAHVEGTPPHGHPIVGSVAVPLPGRTLVPLAAFAGQVALGVLVDPPGRRVPCWDGPTDTPPPRRAAPPILRI